MLLFGHLVLDPFLLICLNLKHEVRKETIHGGEHDDDDDDAPRLLQPSQFLFSLPFSFPFLHFIGLLPRIMYVVR